MNGLPVANTEEARAATQYVSWILSNNYKKEDMVWSTPERSQEEIDRVHKAFDIIWDHVQNGKTSTDTTYDLKKSMRLRTIFTITTSSNQKQIKQMVKQVSALTRKFPACGF